MRDVLLVRYGEVFLKGANRPYFLRMLTENVRKAVKPVGGHVWLSDARIYVSDFSDLQDCIARVTRGLAYTPSALRSRWRRIWDANFRGLHPHDEGLFGHVQGVRPPVGQVVSDEFDGDRPRDRRTGARVEPEPPRGRPQAGAPAERRDSRQRLRLRGGDPGRRRHADGHRRQGGAFAVGRH